MDNTVFFNTSNIDKSTRVFDAGTKGDESKSGLVAQWFFQSNFGRPRGVNTTELRSFGKSCWPRMVISSIRHQVETTEWRIINKDETDETDYTEQITKVTDFLNCSNRNNDTFAELFGPYIYDLLEIDAGSIIKIRNGLGELAELYVRDGSSILVRVDKHGIVEKYFQHSFLNPTNPPVTFETQDVIYGVLNKNTINDPYGFSPLQSVQQVVELLIQSTRFNKDFFQNNAIPDGIFTLPNANKDMISRFKEEWNSEIKGKPHKFAFISGEGKFENFSTSNKEMEWLEGQRWYMNLVFAAYGLSPAELGFSDQVNRASQAGQERVSMRNATKPVLDHLAKKINNEILHELTDVPIKFEWVHKDDVAEQRVFENEMRELQQNVLTINEVRTRRGLTPIDGGDSIMNPFGFSQITGDNQDDRNNDSNDDKDVDDKDKKALFDFVEKTKINSSSVKREAKDYRDLLGKEMKRWEKEMLRGADRFLKDEFEKKEFEIIEKTFGEFLQSIFSTVTTQGFVKTLRVVVRRHLLDGVKEAEEEINVDIGVTENFEQVVDFMKDRQLEGFHINGKKWSGIKGVARQIQVDIAQIVKDGVVNKRGVKKIKKDIKERMAIEKGGKVKGKVTEGRAMRIARTETNRFESAGKLQGFKDSGLQGQKQWIPAPLTDHHPFCDPKANDLAFKIVPMDEPFITKDGHEFQHPPSHPNCKSQIRFVFGDENE